jgi:CRISPR-associated protein Cst2
MSNSKQIPNCLNIAYIFKTSLGSINGSWTEGNVSTVKKITMPDGRLLPYVSGQSLKYQIRKAWIEMGLGEQLSEIKQSDTAHGVNYTAGDPASYIDDDLLGFMIASTGENRRRTAPVRTSAAIGLFPFRGDRDLGTKSKEQVNGDVSAGGNIFETEIYYNYFKVNILVELNRLGKFLPSELHKAMKNNEENRSLSMEIRRERLENLFKALTQIWGGGKQSRILTDMSPKFLAITFQTAKNPIFLESLNVSENEELDTVTINEILNDNSSIIQNQYLGVRSGIFKNDVQSEISDISSIQGAFDSALLYLKTLDF